MSVVSDLQLPLADQPEWTFDGLMRAIEKVERELDVDILWQCYEIVDGVLVVSPLPTPLHQLVAGQLAQALRESVPPGFHIVGALPIEYGRTYRATDVTIAADDVFRTNRSPLVASDVLLAVEVESPSSITTDRITKPAEYAAVGIPNYWRVELTPLRLTTYRLAGDRYEETGSWAAGETVRLTDPFPVEFDIDVLSA